MSGQVKFTSYPESSNAGPDLIMNFKKLIPARFRKDAPTIPVVRLAGVIAASSGSPLSKTLSLSSCASVLEKAFSMKNAPVVAICVNSPGGSPVQSRQIYSRIRQLAAENDKKVLVFVEDVAASGGYMIALAGDEILVDETSIVGSIGVVSAGFGFNKAIEKIGVERRVYTAGKNKVTLDPFQPESKKDIDHLLALQKQVHEVFINMVKERRGERLAKDEDIFSGLFWSGERGLELGLVDGMGHLSTIISERYGKDAELKLITPKTSLLGRPVPSVSGADASAIAGQLADGVISTLEEKSLWARYQL